MEKNIGIADNEVESTAKEDESDRSEVLDFCADPAVSESDAAEFSAYDNDNDGDVAVCPREPDVESESALTEAEPEAENDIAGDIEVETDITSVAESDDCVIFDGEIIEDDIADAAPVFDAEEISFVPRKRNKFAYGCYLFTKRTFDIVSSGLFLILFSWLYLILAIVVKCSDGGTVFYRHKRVGKNGRDIYIPKFRSMKKNADRLEDMLTPEQLEQYRREYKIDNDPRITKIGKFLRKSSLDELPNIWAIFTGKISVIGPRPLMREEAEEKYGAYMDKLLSVKPGMIGWWAANGRSNCTYDSGERQKMELYYVDHCSIWLDIKIVFKTMAGVVRHKGAK